jgi:hypothetical protein
MSGYSRVEFDAVAPLLPGDRVAGRVSGKGEHFEWVVDSHNVHSDMPIRLRQATPRERMSPTYIDLTGVVIGRLTVLGIAAASPQDKKRWVVRCKCGGYEQRRSKFIKRCLSGSNEHEPMCLWCGKTNQLRMGIHDQRKSEAAAETIIQAAK